MPWWQRGWYITTAMAGIQPSVINHRRRAWRLRNRGRGDIIKCLEISKKQGASPKDSSKWGYTIVRREDPSGGRRNSVFTYLAPVSSELGNERGVLRFESDSMALFPEGKKPYSRRTSWGTLVKLYEYKVTGLKTNILRKGGLLSRLDLMLPQVALPVRLHECRSGYRGHEGSFETTLAGLSVRLDDDKAENPSSIPLLPSFASTAKHSR